MILNRSELAHWVNQFPDYDPCGLVNIGTFSNQLLVLAYKAALAQQMSGPHIFSAEQYQIIENAISVQHLCVDSPEPPYA